MKIEFEISDKYKDNNLRLFAGIVPVAEKLRGGNWFVKVGECNMCGLCCMNLRADRHPFPVIDGQCIHLKKRPGNNPRYECFLRINRPFGCCVGIPINIPECTVKYAEVV